MRPILAEFGLRCNVFGKVGGPQFENLKGPALLDDADEIDEFIKRYNGAAGAVFAAICGDRDIKQEAAAGLLRVSTRTIRRLTNGEVAWTLPQLVLLAHAAKTTPAASLGLINSWPASKPLKGKSKKKKR